MIDRELLDYETKKSGHTTADVAKAMKISLSGLSRRINGEIEFRRAEMEAWMTLTGVTNAGPVFFPGIVACPQPKREE